MNLKLANATPEEAPIYDTIVRQNMVIATSMPRQSGDPVNINVSANYDVVFVNSDGVVRSDGRRGNVNMPDLENSDDPDIQEFLRLAEIIFQRMLTDNDVDFLAE